MEKIKYFCNLCLFFVFIPDLNMFPEYDTYLYLQSIIFMPLIQSTKIFGYNKKNCLTERRVYVITFNKITWNWGFVFYNGEHWC